MKKIILSLLFAIAATAALAQGPGPGPGPGPTPDPWVVNGSAISYNGCVLVPASVGGGCKGNGTVNATAIYQAGFQVLGTLANGKIFVGNASAVGIAQTPSGDVTMTNTGVFTVSANVITNAKLAQAAANTMLGNWTGSVENIVAFSMPSCADTGGNHLNYVAGTGITCGTGLGNGITALTGDVTATGPGSVAATLATVNSNVGSFGTATQVGQFTVNAKGLITAVTNVTVTPAVSSITGFGTGVATALAVNVGSAGAFVTFNGAGGTPSSMVGTNITGTAAGLTAGNVTTNANLTGVITSSGNATSIASQTGTGTKFVVDTSPTLVTPVLGVATATSLSIGGATIGTNALAVTGTASISGNITLGSDLSWGPTSQSAAAWTTTGIRTIVNAGTFTDTSSSGTVAAITADAINAATIAASSVTTYTNAYGTYFKAPIASTNVTFTTKAAIGADSINVGGAAAGINVFSVNGGSLFSGSIAVLGGNSLSVLQGGSIIINSGNFNITSVGNYYSAGANTTQDVFLLRAAAANWQLGAADAASPVAQTLQVQSVVTGTSNTAGTDFSIYGSKSTGTGAGGALKFYTSPAGSTGTAVNAGVLALTIDSTKAVTFAGALAVTGTAAFSSSASFGGALTGITNLTASGVIDVSSNAALAIKVASVYSTVIIGYDSAYGLGFSAGIFVKSNGQVIFGAGNYSNGAGVYGAAALNSTAIFGWTGSGANDPGTTQLDTIISRGGAAATIRFGDADAASPVAQTLQVQSVVAGTSNTAGSAWTFNGSKSTGTGVGGDIIWKVSKAGSTGTAQNAGTEAFRIAADSALPKWPSSSTGAGTSTFTNSPCSGLTTEQWVPIEITGHAGTWYVPACQ